MIHYPSILSEFYLPSQTNPLGLLSDALWLVTLGLERLVLSSATQQTNSLLNMFQLLLTNTPSLKCESIDTFTRSTDGVVICI